MPLSVVAQLGIPSCLKRVTGEACRRMPLLRSDRKPNVMTAVDARPGSVAQTVSLKSVDWDCSEEFRVPFSSSLDLGLQVREKLAGEVPDSTPQGKLGANVPKRSWNAVSQMCCADVLSDREGTGKRVVHLMSMQIKHISS